jgi:adenylylsulfate kinase
VSSSNVGPALVVWFCGLPGSGKTTIAEGVYDKVSSSLLERNTLQEKISQVHMDSIRKLIFPHPVYSDEERDTAYRALVLIGSYLSDKGIATLLDGVGHKLVWRDFARKLCPKFVEVYVKCPIEICIQRETSRRSDDNGIREKLYLEALERLKSGRKIEGLGKVPGVDEPFEESPSPEVVIDSSKDAPEKLIEIAIKDLSQFDPDLFSI